MSDEQQHQTTIVTTGLEVHVGAQSLVASAVSHGRRVDVACLDLTGTGPRVWVRYTHKAFPMPSPLTPDDVQALDSAPRVYTCG